MSRNPQLIPLLSGSVALFLTGLNTIPAVQSISDRICRNFPPADEHTLAKSTYRDEDGEASEESLRAFSDKWQRVGIVIFSTIGFLSTLALAVFTTFEVTDFTLLNWLQLGIWVS